MMARRFLLFAFLAFALTATQTAFAQSPRVGAMLAAERVPAGEAAMLTVTLAGASARGAPDISLLENDFTVRAQGQSSRNSMVNGRISFSAEWRFALMPKNGDGAYTVPPVAIDTSEGRMQTRPLSVTFTPVSALPAGDDKLGLSAEAVPAKRDPYVNEPFIYTVRIYSEKPFAEMSAGELTAGNAVIEEIGDFVMYDQVRNGKNARVVEQAYLITPTRAGELTVNALKIQGFLRGQTRPGFSFGNAFGGFLAGRGDSFTLAAPAQTVKVRPPAVKTRPWLPAQQITITEQSDKFRELTVGEPYSRVFTVEARGLPSHVLPALPADAVAGPDAKAYADTPSSADDLQREYISGMKRLSYSVIPLKEGEITFPEITLRWFDTANGRERVAAVPARTMHVLPGATPADTYAAPAAAAPKTVTEAAGGHTAHPPPLFLYTVIALLSAALAVMTGLFLRALRGARPANSGKHGAAVTLRDKRRLLRQFLKADTPAEALAALRNLAAAVEGTTGATVDMLARHAPEPEKADFTAATHMLSAAAYADRPADLAEAKRRAAPAVKRAAYRPRGAVPVQAASGKPALNPY